MTFPERVLRRLSDIPDLRLFPGAPLRDHTRFRLGGPCWLLADAATERAFEMAYQTFVWSNLRWTSIAGGTNLIVSDAGYPGAVLRFSGTNIKKKPVSDTGFFVEVGAGVELNALIDFANEQGLAGMESMAGIPGWVGAAIYGNAGAYGQSIHQRVRSVRFFDGTSVREWSNEECGFRYRHSRFKEDKSLQILSAVLELQPGDPAYLQAKSRDIRATRDAKFPPTMACAGSIFKNLLWKDLPAAAQAAVPAKSIIEGKVPAGWFLEQVGAKGMQVGGIRVADYHANLIYNTGDGTATDLLTLLATLKTRVRHQFNLRIEEEVQFVGFEVDWLVPPGEIDRLTPPDLTRVLTEDNPVLTDVTPMAGQGELLRLLPAAAGARPCVHPVRGPVTLRELL